MVVARVWVKATLPLTSQRAAKAATSNKRLEIRIAHRFTPFRSPFSSSPLRPIPSISPSGGHSSPKSGRIGARRLRLLRRGRNGSDWEEQGACSPAAAISAVLGNDDLLREILLRLDFPTCLVRAAAVSKRWLKHASDPAFLRHFRRLHPPRLLGFFIRTSCSPLRFVPRPQPPELAAFIRRGRFDFGGGYNSLSDCRNGRLIVYIMMPDDDMPGQYTMRSPLHPSKGITALPWPPRTSMTPAGLSVYSKEYMFPEDVGNRMSCTAVTVMRGKEQAWVQLSDLQDGSCGEARNLGLIQLPGQWRRHENFALLAHMKLYMICMSQYILGIDVPSMSHFFIKLPDGVEYEYEADLAMSCADSSGFCLIHVRRFQIRVWRYTMDCNSIGSWTLINTICVPLVFGHLADPTWCSRGTVVRVAAVGDNAEFVFLRIQKKVFYMHILSRTVEKVYELTQEHESLFEVYPFMMVWPPTFPGVDHGHDQDKNPTDLCDGGEEEEAEAAELTPPEAAPLAAAMEAVLGNDDILREILLCLGFPTNLVRAAAVSKRWLRHASDPAFLRRFRARHPPRLLGFYADASGPTPCFIPLPKQDPEVAAVIRKGNFDLGEDVSDISHCLNGRLLVKTWYPPHEFNLAVCSPLHPERGTAALLKHPATVYSNIVSTDLRLRFRLLHEDIGNGMPCTEVQVMGRGDDRRVWVNIPDLQIGAYTEVRTSDPIETPENMIHLKYGLFAYDKLYLFCMKGHILGLELASLILFCIKLPDGVECVYGKELGLSIAEGSGFYLMHVKGFQVHVWHHSTSCSINGKWKLVDTICLREAFGNLADPSWYSQGAAVHVAAVGDNADFVFLKIQDKVFYMQTRSRAVEKVYECPYMFEVHPFMMPWPPTFPVMIDGHDQDNQLLASVPHPARVLDNPLVEYSEYCIDHGSCEFHCEQFYVVQVSSSERCPNDHLLHY
ncbi:hypothetical protein EJB05_24140, partial [Eragrostis curvula]